jgi:hypothetical protein
MAAFFLAQNNLNARLTNHPVAAKQQQMNLFWLIYPFITEQ